MNIYPHKAQQTGVVLVVSLIMLLLLTLISLTAMQVTGLEEKMAGNMRDQNLAFQTAESTLNTAEAGLSLTTIFDAAGTGGFYSVASTIPTDTAILLATFWTTNPIATYDTSGFGNGIADAKYIVQDLGLVACHGSGLSAGDCHAYRVTARATGGSQNSMIMLQSIYQIRI